MVDLFALVVPTERYMEDARARHGMGGTTLVASQSLVLLMPSGCCEGKEPEATPPPPIAMEASQVASQPSVPLVLLRHHEGKEPKATLPHAPLVVVAPQAQRKATTRKRTSRHANL